MTAALCGEAAAQPVDPAALYAEARPHLETVLGVRWEQPPRFGPSTAAEFRTLPDTERDYQLFFQFPNLRGEQLTAARAAATEVCGRLRPIRYRDGEDLVLLLSEAASTASWVESQAPSGMQPAEAYRAFTQLALVHETVRWHLDHRYGLARRWGSCRDPEEFQALQAIAEGRAQSVTRQVAQRLRSESVFPLLTARYRQAPEVTAEPGTRLIAQEVLRRRHWACTHGLAFFAVLERQGLADVERKVFARPPRQAAWIERPELYLRAEQQQLPDLAETLGRLEKALASPEWSPTQTPWTPAMIRQAAALFGERQRGERVAQSWDDGRSVVWSLKNRLDRQVGVGVVRFQDAAGARAYLGLAVDLQRKQDERIAAAGGEGQRLLASRCTAVELRGADEGARCDKKLQLVKDGEPVTISQMWVRVNNRVIEFTWHGLPGDAAWAQRILDEILAAKN